jgi:hypothetical protein
MLCTEAYEAYLDFAVFPLVEEGLVEAKQRRTLVLGCGRATTCNVLYENGFREIVCIDIAPSLITALQQRYRDKPGIECTSRL